MRGYLLALIIALSAMSGGAAEVRAADVVFVCASSTEAAADTERDGLFGRLFGFLFKRNAPTVVTIDCPDGKLPERVTPATSTAPVATTTDPFVPERKLFGFIQRIFSGPPGTPATTTAYLESTKQQPGSGTAAPAKPTPTTQTIERDLADAKKDAAAIEAEIARLKELEKRSKYYGYVTVILQRSGDRKPENEIMTISVSPAAPKELRVPVTKFTITNDYGERFAIPGGTMMPMPGLDNQISDIVLKPGNKIVISTGVSPNGLSFQTNTCTGYFNGGARFNPGLPAQCPYPRQEPWTQNLLSVCNEYINRLPRCSSSYTLPLGMDPECQQIIVKNVSYNACVDAHKSDADFYKGEWRVFLKRGAPIFKTRYDAASVYDEDGKELWKTVF